MKRWLGIASFVLLLIWAPWLYRELSASAPEVEDGDAEFDEGSDEFVEAPPDDAEDDGVEVPEEEPAPTEPVAQAPVEGEEPAADEPGAEGAEGAEGEPEGEAEAPPGVGAAAAAIAGALGTLSKTFESEPRDALWAQGAEAGLRGVIDGAELEEEEVLELLELECRRTVCRAVIDIGDPEADVPFEELFTDYQGRVFPHRAIKSEEAKYAIYVIREGYTMADLQK